VRVCVLVCAGVQYIVSSRASPRRDMPIRVLGFWWWWLFVVPSLRSRRPKGPEKKALDIAFLGTPLISLIAPAVTKDTGVIWGGT
jgi:heme/copper-type cytochrome/quinol oxidase subunit 2